jgi:hypothetical protein
LGWLDSLIHRCVVYVSWDIALLYDSHNWNSFPTAITSRK